VLFIGTQFSNLYTAVDLTCDTVIQAAITTQIYVKALKRADGTGSKADIVAMVCVPNPVH
jgi:hypothetical protein